MSRSNVRQEVACMAALSTAFYPALLHRKVAVGASSGSTAAVPASSTSTSAVGSELLGGPPQEACVPGVVLEVRQLWQPATIKGSAAAPAANAEPSASAHESLSTTYAHATASSAQTENGGLYAFVRVKDADHRLSGWFALSRVYVKLDSALPAFGDSAVAPTATCDEFNSTSATSAAAARGLGDEWTPLSRVLRRPWLSCVYEEVTPGMARTQRARRQLDYLEERLLRDCRTPTTVRYFVYLNTYVFAPWYYAPFGLLNSEYDPVLPCFNDRACAREGDGGGRQSKSASHDGAAAASAAGLSAGAFSTQQPYIRDAFLCPFSLRIFSTYAQLHYETRTYRAGRLRPPGEEIYRDEQRGLSLFRINGSQHVTYCRQLFLIGKSFLENKLAGHDVHSYYFYVVCLHHRYFPHYVSDASAMYFAGFFTWEKHVSEYNLACIATLPCFGRHAASRRPPPSSPLAKRPSSAAAASASSSSPPQVLRNLGQFMIAVSYELAYRRKQIGTPEKPLSDLGAAAYQYYWRRALVRWMKATLNEMHRAVAVDVDSAASAPTSASVPASTPAAAEAAELLERQRDEGRPSVDSVEVVAVVTEEEGDSTVQSEAGAGKRKRARAVTVTTSTGLLNDADADSAADEVADEDGQSPSKRRALLSHANAAPVCDEVAAAQLPASTSSAKSAVGAAVTFSARTTIKEIAAAVRLEEADVLKTLLGLGVLHRSSEDRSTQLLLPERYVNWLYDEVLRWEASVAHAVFQPALLKSRGRAKQ
ncbi:histone acetyltransferase [Lotmaria passim]